MPVGMDSAEELDDPCMGTGGTSSASGRREGPPEMLVARSNAFGEAIGCDNRIGTGGGRVAGILKPATWVKTITFIFVSPLLGMVLGHLILLGLFWIFRRSTPAKVDSYFRRGQLLSAAMYSIGHGGADAQKTTGIIAAVLVAPGSCTISARGATG